MTERSEPIVIEQSFSQSKETVWRAITEHDQMVQWFFAEIPEFRAETGFETRFNINTGEREFMHLWKITDAIPQQKIVYDWRYENCPGAGTVTMELFDEGEGSLLRITNEGLESFPDDVPEFTVESCVGGWTYFIQGTLKQFLEPDSVT